LAAWERSADRSIAKHCAANVAWLRPCPRAAKLPKPDGIFRKVKPILEDVAGPGPKNRLTLECLYQFARTLCKEEKVAEARAVAKQVLDGCRDALGEKHPDTVKAEELFDHLNTRDPPDIIGAQAKNDCRPCDNSRIAD